jgi:hypothetical protein
MRHLRAGSVLLCAAWTCCVARLKKKVLTFISFSEFLNEEFMRNKNVKFLMGNNI